MSLSISEMLGKFKNKKVLVIGDIMLDTYIWCKVVGSNEDNTLILAEERRTYAPGGAGNVAMNLAGLGARVHLIGGVGDDEEWKTLACQLDYANISTDNVIFTPEHVTTTKTRIMVGSRVHLRVDWERYHEPRFRDVCATFNILFKGVDAIILADHNKGMITDIVARYVIEMANAHNIPVIADPARAVDPYRYKGVALTKPNEQEYSEHCKHLNPNSRYGTYPSYQFNNMLVTKGENGMDFYPLKQWGEETNGTGCPAPTHIPSFSPENPDGVVDGLGAGDTVCAVMALTLASKLPLEDGCKLAARAAGIVCSRPGTVAITSQDLLNSEP